MKTAEGRVTPRQLAALLFLSRAFTCLALSGGSDAPLALPLSFALQVPVMLLALRLAKKQILRHAAVRAVLLAACLAAAVQTLRLSASLVTSGVSGISGTALLLFLAAAGALAAARGHQALARSAVLLFFGALAGLAVVLLSLWGCYDAANLAPLEFSAPSVLSGALRGLARNAELLLLPVLAPDAPDFGPRHGVLWLGGAAALSLGLAAVTALVLGPYASGKRYPLLSAVSCARSAAFGRADAVFLGVWAALGFVRLSLFLWAAGRMLPKLKPARRPLLPAAAAVLASLLLGGCAASSDRACVTALGVRATRTGVEVTAEVLSPTPEDSGATALCSGEGESCLAAIADAQRACGRTLYTGTCRALVIGAGSARELLSLLSELDGAGAARTGTAVCLADDPAALLGSCAPEGFASAASVLYEENGVTLLTSLNSLADPGRGLLLPVFDFDGGPCVAALACGPALTRIPPEAVGALPLSGQKLSVALSPEPGTDLALDHVALRAIPTESDAGISFELRVTARGRLLRGPDPEKAASEAEKALEETVSGLLERAVRGGNSDIFCFGKALSKKDPDRWKEASESWAQALETLPVSVSARVVLADRRGG